MIAWQEIFITLPEAYTMMSDWQEKNRARLREIAAEIRAKTLLRGRGHAEGEMAGSRGGKGRDKEAVRRARKRYEEKRKALGKRKR